ncbi:MAG: DUF3592 domain-containing protein [Bacteroidia bacterium]|nr:DUF3592 domain-containing protein [Bacteroidia bacterium]
MKKKKLGITALVLLGIGIIFLAVTLQNISRDKKLEAGGITTTATVVKQFISRSGKGASHTHWLRVTYQVENSLNHELNSEVSEDFWNNHPENTTVRVRYLKSNPDTADILETALGQKSYFVQFIIAAIIIAGGLVFLIIRFRQPNTPLR